MYDLSSRLIHIDFTGVPVSLLSLITWSALANWNECDVICNLQSVHDFLPVVTRWCRMGSQWKSPNFSSRRWRLMLLTFVSTTVKWPATRPWWLTLGSRVVLVRCSTTTNSVVSSCCHIYYSIWNFLRYFRILRHASSKVCMCCLNLNPWWPQKFSHFISVSGIASMFYSVKDIIARIHTHWEFT